MMRKFPLFEAACLAAMVAAPVALGLVLSTGSPATAAEKEKKPAVAVECTAPCINSYEIDDGAVGAADIATDAVDADAIGTGAVGGDEISDGAIGLGKLGFDPATQDELNSQFTLGDLTCDNTQVAKRIAGAWTCADDEDVSQPDINGLMANIENLTALQTLGASAYVFVTSISYTGDLVSWAKKWVDPSFTGTGVEAADLLCQWHADKGKLPGFYKAWIADGTEESAPHFRFTKAPSDYILPQNEHGFRTTVADRYFDLTFCLGAPGDGLDCLDWGIKTHEDGHSLYSSDKHAWTNVRPSGKVLLFPAYCDGWTSSSRERDGAVGFPGKESELWTRPLVKDDRYESCASYNYLYCFGQ